ncbi:MAG: HPr family phosphocarrier protein, partial [Clostridium sp.]|nr:HPr family phosphocarrier protein [Clostridium sp.]
DVKDFVEISSKYCDGEIIIEQDQYRVDGKSILAIFSLNLLKPVEVIIYSACENAVEAFCGKIEKWEVK